MTACQLQKTNSSYNGVKSRYQAGSPSSQHLSLGICNGVDDNEESRASSIAQFQEFRYKDGGAHWYRSSAVLLRYHKYESSDFQVMYFTKECNISQLK